MTAIILWALGLFLIQQSCSSASQPKVVSLSLRRKSHAGAAAHRVKRETFSGSLEDRSYFYFGTVGVGTPPQLVELLVGTNIGDTWMFGTGACQGRSGCIGGEFNISQSNTSLVRSDLGQFNEKYVSGANAHGPYFNDDLAFGGVLFKNITMGLASEANGIDYGAIGLGFPSLEAGAVGGNARYLNLPDQLVSQGLTKSRCYSLYLADPDRLTGTLLFGGYDTEKFSGPLTMLPLENNPYIALPAKWFVSLTGFGLNLKNLDQIIESPHDPYPMLVMIDSGSALIDMPLEFVLAFKDLFKLKQGDTLYDPWQIECDIWRQFSPASVFFFFGGEEDGVQIPVPLREMIIPVYNDNGVQDTLNNGSAYCVFALVAQSPGSTPTLGLPFLRSAYSFYSLDGPAVGLAPVKPDNGQSHIVEYSNLDPENDIKTDADEPKAYTINYSASSYTVNISKASVTILSSKEQIAYTQITASLLTSIPTALTPAGDTIPTPTKVSHTSNTSSSSSSSSQGGNSHLGVEVGVPVGVVGGLVILGLAFFFWRRRNRRAKQAQLDGSADGAEPKMQQTPHSAAGPFSDASGGSQYDPSKSPPAPSYTPAEGFYGAGIVSDKPPVIEEVPRQSRVVSDSLAPSDRDNFRESHLSGVSTVTEGGGATSPVSGPVELPGHPLEPSELPIQSPTTSELPDNNLK